MFHEAILTCDKSDKQKEKGTEVRRSMMSATLVQMTPTPTIFSAVVVPPPLQPVLLLDPLISLCLHKLPASMLKPQIAMLRT